MLDRGLHYDFQQNNIIFLLYYRYISYVKLFKSPINK